MPSSPTDLAARMRAEFGPLRRAEKLLVQSLAFGEIAKVGLVRPDSGTAEVSIRGSFLAFVVRRVLTGKGRPLQLIGAFVEGGVDLGDVAIAGSLWFYRCRFDSALRLTGARVSGAVTFAGCRLAGLAAERCTIAEDLSINAGTRVGAGLRLSRAHIGGDLDCARLDLRGTEDAAPMRRALVADAVRVAGDVRLADGFEAVGEVRFLAARVEGDFVAGGHFTGGLTGEGQRATALLLDRIEVAGSLRFDRRFGAAGGVSLRRARIAGDLDATGSNFDRLGEAAWNAGAALVLDRARIEGALVLQGLQSPLLGASFADARVGILADDETTWGERLVLDGFAYGRLGDGAPLDTVFRVGWLECQPPAHLKAQFRGQPWRRLIRVLRRMGHEHRAGSIAVRREACLRRSGWVGSWAPVPMRWLPRAGHALLGLLAGYGYRPARLLLWLGAVWLLCAGVYWATAEQDTALLAVGATSAAVGSLAYSLERLLPLAALGQPQGWTAGATWAAAVHWLGRFEAGFGWAASLILLASVAGWLDRDRR